MEPSRKAQEFQEMIKTRKAELKEKKGKVRRDLVKNLHERKLMVENESRSKLFGLPDEMWAEILSHVQNPRDLINLWEVHPRFRDLSQKSKVQECLLFQLLGIKNLPYLREDHGAMEDSSPDLLTDLKTLRTFSKGMKNAVDHHIEEEFEKALRSSNGEINHLANTIELNEMSVLNDLLENYCRGSSETRGKRVFHRAISTWIASDNLPTGKEHECFMEFKDKMISLFESVGDQIWYFSYISIMEELSKLGVEITEAYLFLRKLVSLMPNLKWLEMNFDAYCESYINGNNNVKQANSNSMKSIMDHPFPHLRHLERIHFGNFPSLQIMTTLVTAVLQSNLQIKSMSLTGFQKCAENRLFLEELKPLLSSLKLNMFLGNCALNPAIIEIMEPLVSNWKLKSLSHRFGGDGLELGTFFHYLNHIPTLESLSLYMFDITVGKELPSLRLPNLINFKFYFENNDAFLVNYSTSSTEGIISLFSLNFLRNSQSLKGLDWSMKFGERRLMKKLERFMISHERHGEMVNFRGGLRDLTFSNLWEVFPELESVETRITFDKDYYYTNFDTMTREKLFGWTVKTRKYGIAEVKQKLTDIGKYI